MHHSLFLKTFRMILYFIISILKIETYTIEIKETKKIIFLLF